MAWLLVVIVLTGVTSSYKGNPDDRPIGVYRTERECNDAMARAYLDRDFYNLLPDGARPIGMRCRFVSLRGLS